MKHRPKKRTSEGSILIPGITAECRCPKCGVLWTLKTSGCMDVAYVTLPKRKS